MYTIQNNSEEKVFTVRFSGRLDALAVQGMVEVIQSEILENEFDSDTKIVFDLEDVNYIASAFIRACVSVAKQTTLGNFCIVNCQPIIKKTFKIAGLDEVLKVN